MFSSTSTSQIVDNILDSDKKVSEAGGEANRWQIRNTAAGVAECRWIARVTE